MAAWMVDNANPDPLKVRVLVSICRDCRAFMASAMESNPGVQLYLDLGMRRTFLPAFDD